MRSAYREADLPLIDADGEETKQRHTAQPRHSSSLSVSDSFTIPLGPDEISGEDPVSKRHCITVKMVAMGFSPAMVMALMRNFEPTDLGSAIEMLDKTEHGWTHFYIPQEVNGNLCEICGEGRSEHIEGKITESEDQHFTMNQTTPMGTRDETADFHTPSDPYSNSRQCNICMMGIAPGMEFALNCGHTHCYNCVRTYLEAEIRVGKVVGLKCPQEGCDCLFTREKIASICDKAVYEKYLQFRENVEVNINKNLKWCPAPNCGRTVKGDASSPHVVCECGFEMCFRCGERWHPGTSCAKNYENLYSNWARGKKIQRCPQCRIRIEKNEGCNHMTCPSCRYEWCWICGHAYSHTHFTDSFFGCPLLQFTSTDWSMGTIAIVQLMIFLLWPLIFLFDVICYCGRVVCNFLECFNCACCQFIIVLVVIFPMSAVVYTVMLIPTWLYRGYNVLYVLVRVCRNAG